MSEIETGGPAFPVECSWRDGKLLGGAQTGNYQGWEMGLTVRDYMAAKALAALIGHEDKDYENRGKKAVPILAKWAYEYADAMIEARES